MSTSARSTTTGIAFVSGLLLGSLLIAPVIPEVLATLPSLSSIGTVGRVLLAGALGVLLLIFGIIALYLAFLMVED